MPDTRRLGDRYLNQTNALPYSSWRKMTLAAIASGTNLQPKYGVSIPWIKGYIAAVWYCQNGESIAAGGYDNDIEQFCVGKDAVDNPHKVKPWQVSKPYCWRDSHFDEIEEKFNASKKLRQAIKAELKAGRIIQVKKGSMYKLA